METNTDTRRARLISDIFRELPSSFEDCFDVLVATRKLFFSQLAKAVEQPLNDWLRSMPQDTIAEKRNLAIIANNRLHELHLAIASPRNGEPAILGAYAKDADHDEGRFRIELRDGRRQRIPSVTSRELPYLAVIENPPRREALAGLVKSATTSRDP